MTEHDDSAPTSVPRGSERKLDPDPTLPSAAAAAWKTAELGSVGRYRLLSKLGEGGMGQVWLAEQTAPVRRQVALKLIKAGRYDASALQRFDLERQSLAIMDHPAIAKVLDADSTPEGQPYFVMEYVPGLPITTYCDERKLTFRERLKLFVKVCDGVQHAHQKAIIHRDLKPSNVLVIELDGKPLPRIIDFGIAKAASPQSQDETGITRLGAMLGTPGYMSPEQTDPTFTDVDTRADVYSLGVILYELLTGYLPFDPKQWHKKPLDEVLRQLRQDDPPSPSTRLSTELKTASDIAEKRGVETRQLVSLLRGDLDWIVLKALEKDRSRRYGSPSDLAADVTRYLRHEPVIARPASLGYRLRKYVQRHRLAATFASALLALLVGFGITEFLQLRRVTRERDRANHITEFMVNMFQVSDPSEARGNSITAREILNKASDQIKTALAKDPEVQSDLMYTMARTYSNLGLFTVAHNLAQPALEIRRRIFGPQHVKTLESSIQLGWILDRQGQEVEAEKLSLATLQTAQRTLGPNDSRTLQAMDNLAVISDREGHYSDEENWARQVIAIRSRTLGPDNPDTLRSMSNLGAALHGEGRNAEAEKLFRQLLETERRVLGTEHPAVIVTMHNLSNVISEQGRYSEAEQLYRETLATEQRVLGPDHPDTTSTMTTLANTIFFGESRTADAEALYRQALEIEERALGPEHPYTLGTLEGLANVLSAQGHYAEAEKMHRQILAVRIRTQGPEHTDTLLTKYNVADVLSREGRYSDAERMFRETYEAQARVLGPEDADTLASKASLAKTLISLHQYSEAQTMAEEVFDIQVRKLGPLHADTLSTLQYLGTAMAHNHRYADARKLFTDIIAKAGAAQQSNLTIAWYNFACVAAAANDRDSAIHYLQQAIDHGFTDFDHMRIDDDLKSLRSDRRFTALLNSASSSSTDAKTK